LLRFEKPRNSAVRGMMNYRKDGGNYGSLNRRWGRRLERKAKILAYEINKLLGHKCERVRERKTYYNHKPCWNERLVPQGRRENRVDCAECLL